MKGEPLRLLLVDDDELVLDVTKTLLEHAGFEVTCHSSPLGISATVKKTRPHLVLIDVSMPALSGDRVVEVLKKTSFVRESRVLLFSALPPEELEALVARCGADGYVRKTAKHGDLIAALKQHAREIGLGEGARRST